MYASALAEYKRKREQIDLNIPLDMNGIAGVNNIKLILQSQNVKVDINSENGRTTLNNIELKETLTALNQSLTTAMI